MVKKIGTTTYTNGKEPDVTDRIGKLLPYRDQPAVDVSRFSLKEAALGGKKRSDFVEREELGGFHIAFKVCKDRSLGGSARRCACVSTHLAGELAPWKNGDR